MQLTVTPKYTNLKDKIESILNKNSECLDIQNKISELLNCNLNDVEVYKTGEL